MPKSLVTPSIIGHTFGLVLKHWPEGDIEPNLVDVISALNGWNPLEPGEVMRVHLGEGYYEIHRLPKAEPCLHQRITTVAGHMGPVCGDCGVMV